MRLILLLFISMNVYSQTKKLDTVFCDCHIAKVIGINGKVKYGKTIAPMGPGEIKEISIAKQKTNFAFDKEHHTAWYKLTINTTGDLTFTITPTKAGDDYDFMLFKTGANFCDSLQANKINPIRACISRDKEELLGKTGLNFEATNEFVKYGVGPAYSKYISVIKGEVYYLVLDNVYDKGDGHLLDIEISQAATFNGVVLDENSKPIKAEIALTNQIGDTISLENTNDDGSYNFIAPLVKNQSYNLNFYNDSSFSYTKAITVSDTVKQYLLKTVLPKLKKGKKYSVGAINFVGGSVQYLPRSIL